MKKLLWIVGVVLLLFLGISSPSSVRFNEIMIENNRKTDSLKQIIEYYKEVNDSICIENSMLTNNFYAFVSFRDALALSESGNNPYIVNAIYAMGKYQYLKSSAKRLGYKLDPELLKNDSTHFPEYIQDMSFNRWVQILEEKIYKFGLEEYIGMVYNDSIEITKSGLIAGAHLSGVGGVKDFLESDGKLDYDDGYSNVSDYLYKFRGYNF